LTDFFLVYNKMEKARPKRKMNLEEIYKNDLMFLILGKQYVDIKQKNDNDNKKPSIDNSQEQRPDKPECLRKRRDTKSLSSYPM
jgi:hypothetical protein